MAGAPLREVELGPVKIAATEAPGGALVIRSELPLEPYEANLGALLRRSAAAVPERPFLAERDHDQTRWRHLSYGEAAAHAEALGQALLERGLGPERPLLILSGNSLDHALLMLAALLVGVPVVPVSVAYSTLSRDFGTLRAIARLVRPGLVFAADGEAFAAAIASLPGPPAEVVVRRAAPGLRATNLATLLATTPTAAVRQAAERVDPGKGLLFDGRIAEDFKLTTGTWVPCGKVRVAALAAASPLLRDAVVAGADRASVGLLVWLNPPAASRLAGVPAGDQAAVARAPAVRDGIRAGIAAHNAAQTGSATVVRRVLVMTEPPSMDAGEITDKGYVNQRATLDRRQDLVERLFASPPDPDVIVVDD